MITVTVSVLSRLAEIFFQSSLLIAVVFLLRIVSGERLDKRLRYYLWLPVILRLLLPFSVGSRFSVMNLFSTAAHIGTAKTTMLSGASVLNGESARSAAQTAHQTIFASFPWETVILCVWLTGAVVVGSYALRGNLRFYSKLKTDRKEADIGFMSGLCAQMGIKRTPMVYISDKSASPCAVGIFRPAIYLPSWAVSDCEQLRYILMHELTHIKRRDNLLSLFLSICCAAYWFDPLVWVMAFSARRDRELACDAWVTGGMSACERTAYGMALVSAIRMQSGRCTRAYASSFSSRKNEMLDRIKAIKSDRLSAKWLTITVCAVMACAVISFGTSATVLTEDGGISESISDIGRENNAVSHVYSAADGNSFSIFNPVLLGTVKRCDSDTAILLQENFRTGGDWMEIEPYTFPNGTEDLYNELLNTIATGTDTLTNGYHLYKVIEHTGVGHGIYIIGRDDLRLLDDRLFILIR